VLDTLNHLGIEFVSFRENLDTGGPLGRAVIVIVSAVAGLERTLIIERVRAGLRRARLEGRQLGRKAIEIDRLSLLRDRARGLSLAQLSKAYKISRTSLARAPQARPLRVCHNPPLPPTQPALKIFHLTPRKLCPDACNGIHRFRRFTNDGISRSSARW
jgi:Resolvase, N terminal domain